MARPTIYFRDYAVDQCSRTDPRLTIRCRPHGLQHSTTIHFLPVL